MERRDFLYRSGMVLAAGAASGLLSGCTGGHPAANPGLDPSYADTTGPGPTPRSTVYHTEFGPQPHAHADAAAAGGSSAPCPVPTVADVGPLEPIRLGATTKPAVGAVVGTRRLTYPGPPPTPISAVGRGAWKAAKPASRRLNPMGAVQRVTIHHEGAPKANWDVASRQVADTLRRIQSAHFSRMKAGDIGYHYIIDRVGRVWEGRPVGYQGAHVKYNNKNNLGVMCLGNFEKQKPTQQQIIALDRLIHTLMHGYRVPVDRLYTHRDLRPTQCPGRYMLPVVEKIRLRLRLACVQDVISV